MTASPPAPTLPARRLTIRGVVQGVGFRPFVHALATRLGVRGWVLNAGGVVVVHAEGAPAVLDRFAHALASDAPRLAHIAEITSKAAASTASCTFAIRTSELAAPASDAGAAGDSRRRRAPAQTAGTPGVGIPADVATCDACLAELADPADRRFRYPFINCTACGPRYTIVTDVPYDRARTTMRAFPMCTACESEYRNPADRRFHAEPIACPACGPQLWFEAVGGAADAVGGVRGDAAIARACAVLDAGGILALKGIGGFHLVCDATNDAAVQTLRTRKQRPTKPLALMVASLADARRIAHVEEDDAAALTDPARPIVLLAPHRLADGRDDAPPRLGEAIAPGLDRLGVMLPYAPVHALLADRMPLVVTSGNLSEEPIALDNEDARHRLGPLVDGLLLHDRVIHTPCDDSVVQVVDGHLLPLRRARGYAPLAIALGTAGEPVLATGADLKAALCVAAGTEAVMSQHIGDQGSPATQEAFAQVARRLRESVGVTPVAIACDAHPGYLSSAWAQATAAEAGVPLLRVQHHHAHVAALLAEHRLADDAPCLGVAFDGTGYGPDGAIWGGEVLLATATRFARAAHLSYVPLPGGDGAVRHPRRMALAHLFAAGLPWDERWPAVAATPAGERPILARQLARGLGCVPTSSVGRLLDAISSLLGLVHHSTHEGEAAMSLEAEARRHDADLDALAHADASLLPFDAASAVTDAAWPMTLDVGAIVRALARARDGGDSVPRLAWRAHATLVQWVRACCRQLRARTGVDLVGLSGGAMQNALLLGGVARALRAERFTVLLPTQVPPNDGGLALGQALVVQATLRAPRRPTPVSAAPLPLLYSPEWTR